MPAQPIQLTLITCTRNSERYLQACLDSVKLQSQQPFEHLFIDTNSTDRTLEIIRAYNSKSRIVNSGQPGLYRSLNVGLREAHGNIIGFLHSDDAFTDPGCLARIIVAFKKNPELRFYCSRMTIFDQSLSRQFAILGAAPHKPTLREQLYSSNYYAHPTYYCSRAAIEKNGPYNEGYSIAGDIDWLIRLEQLKLSYYFDPQPLVKFRTETGVSSKRYLKALREEWKIQKQYYGLSPELIAIFTWHFVRRILRLIFEKIHMGGMVTWLRKLISKILRA